MKSILFLVFFFFFSLVFCQGDKPIEFQMCGDANVPLKQLKMRHSPAVLRSGTNFTVYTDGEQTSDSPLTNGVSTSRTSYLGIEVQVNRHSICDSIQGGCPVKKLIGLSQPAKMYSQL